jgi:hypothetical protein
MGHKVNSDLQQKAVHAGVNGVVAQYTLNETASGSTTIVIAALPGGAEVLDSAVKINHGALNAGANAGAVRVYATIGGTEVGELIATSTVDTALSVGVGAGHGERLTGSANLVAELHDCAGTGTASTVITVICNYLAEKESD